MLLLDPFLGVESPAGDQVVAPIGVIFKPFEAEKGDAQKGSQHQEEKRLPFLPQFRGVNGQHHHQTAHQQDHGVNAADDPVELLARFHECFVMHVGVGAQSHEQRSEEHHLGGQEDPHAQGGSVVLLLEVGVWLFEAMAHEHGPMLDDLALLGGPDGRFAKFHFAPFVGGIRTARGKPRVFRGSCPWAGARAFATPVR